MNNIQVFKNQELNLQVRTTKNEDGSISINAEDTAVGYGWTTVAKSGNDVVRWARMNEYLKDLGFSHQVGKEDYIPEELFYLLGFKANNDRALAYQKWLAVEVLPTLRKTGSYTMPKTEKRRNTLSPINTAAKILVSTYKAAGVDPTYIAVAVDNLYKKEAGIDLGVPLISEHPKLYDCTEMAKELNIVSKAGKPHDKAVSAIIQKLDVSDKDKVSTAFERNGHSDVTVQYTPAVFDSVRKWVEDNGYPTQIPFRLSNGNTSTCHVIYRRDSE